jgi:hypothetical protein
VRIPDGDLVPARRRPYRGPYARRRVVRRRLVVVVALVVLIAAGAWYLTRDGRALALGACTQNHAPCVAMTLG